MAHRTVVSWEEWSRHFPRANAEYGGPSRSRLERGVVARCVAVRANGVVPASRTRARRALSKVRQTWNCAVSAAVVVKRIRRMVRNRGPLIEVAAAEEDHYTRRRESQSIPADGRRSACRVTASQQDGKGMSARRQRGEGFWRWKASFRLMSRRPVDSSTRARHRRVDRALGAPTGILRTGGGGAGGRPGG